MLLPTQNQPPHELIDALGTRHAVVTAPPRIVSLVPSITELVCDLGLADALVGRTGFCIHPRATVRRIPKVGGTKDVNLARIRELAPTHVIVNNLLRKPGGLTLNGVPIDLGKVKVPLYFASTLEDHIAPWKSTYAGAQLFTGKKRFVLGGSGHIAGIINPPAANKYGYWTNDQPADTPQAWLAAAAQHAGSWWSDWAKWVEQYAGDKVPARVPGDGKLKALEDAPGSFVKLRLDSKHAA